jgi:hypothetical protein
LLSNTFSLCSYRKRTSFIPIQNHRQNYKPVHKYPLAQKYLSLHGDPRFFNYY